VTKQRGRTKQETSLGERLTEQAKSLREQAETLRPRERDSLIRRARQAETAAHINE
jgi:hypothetical protein